MAGILSSFYIGVSGLQSSQYALNTTAHNLANINTEGYSRQQVMLTDMTYHRLSFAPSGINKSGLGTKIADVRIVRDAFVDRAYRTEVGREQFYRTKYDVVKEVEAYFGELESSTFRGYMTDLWTSAQELQKESNSIVTRSSYISHAVIFLSQANQIYDELKTYQKNLNKEIRDQVDQINDLAEMIHELNKEILKVEAAGIESANDYRDARDLALDQLSALVKISYEESLNGTVEVYAENRTLVSLDRVFKLDVVEVSESCNYLKPVWAADGDDLFFLARVPSAENKADIGSLKALLMSRGDFVANYTDIPKMPEDTTNAADMQAYQEAVQWYNTWLEPYTVNNMIAEFDQLIHGIVTAINDVLCPNKQVTLSNGDVVWILDEEQAGIGMGDGNQYAGTELFVRNSVSRYREELWTYTDENGVSQTGTIMIYNEEFFERDPIDGDWYSLYTLGNMKVNPDLLKNPSLLPLSNIQGEELQETANRLITIWSDPFSTLNPNSRVTNNFFGYYNEFVGDFANKGMTYHGIADTQLQAAFELNSQRQQVVGVSSDEELSNLIRFQQAYNASSRYFTVISEMTEHLIMRLG